MADGIGGPASGPAHAHNRISDAAASSVGLQRAHNEDAHSRPPVGANLARYGSLFALADGVGSRPDGASASWTAVHLLQAVYYAPSGSPQPADRLREAVEAVNVLNRTLRRLGSNGETAGRPPGSAESLTTLVAALVYNDHIWVANVGDSRAYLVRARTRECHPLTEDHSQVMPQSQTGATAAPPPPTQPPADWPPAADPGATVRTSTIQRTQPLARVQPATRALTRAIGLEEHCQVDVYSYTWEEGDRLVLCSDGLDAVGEPLMVETVLGMAPEDSADRLVAEAITLDGSDNTTVVVVARRSQRTSGTRRRRSKQRSWTQLIALTVVAVAFGAALGLLSAALISLYLTGGLF